jgi:hypothetical protein
MAVLHVSSTVVISSFHFLENKSGTSPPPVHGCLLEVGGRSWTHVPVTVHGCLLEVCGPSIRIDACLYHVHTTKDNPSSWHEASKGKCNEEESIQMPQEATVVTPPQKEIQQQWHPAPVRYWKGLPGPALCRECADTGIPLPPGGFRQRPSASGRLWRASRRRPATFFKAFQILSGGPIASDGGWPTGGWLPLCLRESHRRQTPRPFPDARGCASRCRPPPGPFPMPADAPSRRRPPPGPSPVPVAASPRGPFPMPADARPRLRPPLGPFPMPADARPAATRPRPFPLSRCPQTMRPCRSPPQGPFADAWTCLPTAAQPQGPFPMPADAPGDARQSRPDACQSRPEALPPARRHRERARGWASAGTRIHPGGGAFVFHRLYNNTYEHLRHCCIEYVRVWMHYLEDCHFFLDCTLGRQIRTSLVVKQLLSPNVLAPNIFVLVK